jgi:hypothetical protein
MSINPDVDGTVTLDLAAPIEQTNGHAALAAAEVVEATPVVAEMMPPIVETSPAPAQVPTEGKASRVRPKWLASVAVGAVGLIASGALGYLAYATAQQRDGLHRQLVSTAATLVSTQGELTAAQADAATRKVTADYVATYIADAGKVQTDYQDVGACDSFSACRTSSQQMLQDLQSFQSDRKAAVVPASLSASDSSLGDALSAAIAADQEIISGMDSDNLNSFTDGLKKLDAAMLNVAKAEAALGAELK